MKRIIKVCKIICQLIWLVGVALLVAAMFWTNEYWETPVLSRTPEDWLFIAAVGVIGIAIGLTIGIAVLMPTCKKLLQK